MTLSFFFGVMYWCFEGLGPWRNPNHLLTMCIREVIVATHTTEPIIPIVRIIPLAVGMLLYLSSS